MSDKGTSELTQVATTVMKLCWTGEQLLAGLSQVCNNVMGHLNAKGLYPTLEVSHTSHASLVLLF